MERKARSARARGRRGRTPLPEGERKDKLVQTRVDEELDAALRDAARERRVTVSHLIRNVLEDTFHLVDNVVADAAALTANVRRDARRVADAARGRRRDPLADVVAWQQVVLGKPARCARCDGELRRGEPAMMSVGDAEGAERLWLCSACAAQL